MSRIMMKLATLLLISIAVASCTYVHAFSDLPRTEGAEIEECLIDFSQKMAAVSPDQLLSLDRDRFFAVLEPAYSDRTCLDRVMAYPIQVRSEGQSYVLTVCEKGRRWLLFEDDGRTIDQVDRAYVREGKKVSCPIR